MSWAQGVGRGACEAPMAALSSAGASCPLTCVPRSQVPESPWKSLPTLVLVLLKCLFHFQLHFTQSTMQQFAGRPWVTQLLLFLCGSLLSLPETPSEKRRGLQLGDTAPVQSRAAGACPQPPDSSWGWTRLGQAGVPELREGGHPRARRVLLWSDKDGALGAGPACPTAVPPAGG